MCGDVQENDLMIFHGTSQDGAKEKENTVKVAKQARAVGRRVIELGGPGSAEVAAKHNHVPDQLIHEMHPGLDYLKSLMAGLALGEGVGRIAEEAVDALRPKIEAGQQVDLIGFSRGAVIATLVMAKLGMIYADPRKSSPLPCIRLTLLDPVPGPVLIPQFVILAGSLIKNIDITYSKHEGRFGFDQLGLEFHGDPSRVVGNMSVGRHGDVGGSTESDLARVNLRSVLKKHALAGPDLMSDSDLFDASVQGLINPQQYSDRFKFKTRLFGDAVTPWQPTGRADMEFSSSATQRRLARSALGKLITRAEPWPEDGELPQAVKNELHHLRPKTLLDTAALLQLRTERPVTLMTNPAPRIAQRKLWTPPPAVRVLPRLSPKSTAPAIGALQKAASAVVFVASKGRIKP